MYCFTSEFFTYSMDDLEFEREFNDFEAGDISEALIETGVLRMMYAQ